MVYSIRFYKDKQEADLKDFIVFDNQVVIYDFYQESFRRVLVELRVGEGNKLYY